MDVLGGFLHFLSLFAPALGVALLATGLAKALWRRELAGVAWSRLFGASAAAQSVVLLGALVVSGRDGKMASYLLMLIAGATALWWVGFVRPVRR